MGCAGWLGLIYQLEILYTARAEDIVGVAVVGIIPSASPDGSWESGVLVAAGRRRHRRLPQMD